MISLVVLSGRSGSGKSTALHVLEDMGYYCIDNLPVSLLDPLLQRIIKHVTQNKIAIGIDARNVAVDLAMFPEIMGHLDPAVKKQVVFLDSSNVTLIKRFSETKRKHPLTYEGKNLRDALDLETQLLDPIRTMADLVINTTYLTMHDLRDLICNRLVGNKQELALLFQSFAFKSGVPMDADMVFDVRCLPNPYWMTNLRHLTGLDAPVAEFLSQHQTVTSLLHDIRTYLATWLPHFEDNNRNYVTVAIGCTGGQHRSVYIAHQLHIYFQSKWKNAQMDHLGLRKRFEGSK